MKSLLPHFLKHVALLSLALALFSCRDDDSLDKRLPAAHNSFALNINGKTWEPSLIGTDTCRRTFQAQIREIHSSKGKLPSYTLTAYKDPHSVTNLKSENVFTLQISEVKDPGNYPITGFYEHDFDSYATFVINKSDGSFSRYTNREWTSPFTVTVTKLLPLNIPGATQKGIEGTYKGTLFNETNPLDSLTLKGSFSIELFGTDMVNFNQCRN